MDKITTNLQEATFTQGEPRAFYGMAPLGVDYSAGLSLVPSAPAAAVKPAKQPKVIEIRDIPVGSFKRYGKVHECQPLVGHHADIIPGVSIRLHGIETNRVGGPVSYDHTFKIGDTVIEHSYNFAYFGTITAIGAKTITIQKDHGGGVKRLNIATFSNRNRMLDLAAEHKRRNEWSD